MAKKTVKIIDEAGLHIRPASIVVKEAAKHKDNVQMVYNSKKANMKSILSLMTLGVKSGESVDIIVEGDTAEQTLEAIVKSLEANKLI